MAAAPQTPPADPWGQQDPTLGGALQRFARGASYLPRGIRFLLQRHPRLLPFCAVPAVLNTLLFLLSLVALAYFGGSLKDWLFGLVAGEHHWALMILVYTLKALIWVVYVAACLLISASIVYLGGNLLASPFNDLLSEKIEEAYTGRPAPEFQWRRFVVGIGLTVSEEIKRLAFFVLVMVLLQLLHLIPAVGSVLNMILGALFTCVFLAMEYLSLPMARRFYLFGQWLAAVRANKALALGFGGVCAALLWVPLLNFVVIPVAVIGGTLLYCDLQWAGKLPPPPDLRRLAPRAPRPAPPGSAA